MTPTIRSETAADHEAVRDVNRLAFGRDDEAGIVAALRAGGHSRVSLVAEADGRVVGHVLFSDLPILTDGGTVAALSLAPMAVLPEFQRRGVGSALVREGLEVCRAAGHRIVVVLGHPAFYPRFGFSAGLAEPLANPFHGGEAWMAVELVPGALGGVTGWVRYPPPFGAGGRVRLRPVGPGDLPRIYDQQVDPDSNRMAVTTPRTKEAFDAHWAGVLADPAVTARAILVGEQVVGIVSCFPMDGQDHVGYWIDRAHWGQGIASRALHLLLEEVVRRPLVATAATGNGASLRVLQKCGFVLTEVRRDPATDRHPECEKAVLVLR
jgi:putative acetyltransferase